jgi:hypothetical protein
MIKAANDIVRMVDLVGRSAHALSAHTEDGEA